MKALYFSMALACFHVVTVTAQQKLVTLDSYFNDEHRKDANGKMESFHYKWEETDNNGYSILGNLFKENGAGLNTLYEAPTPANLKGSDVYIIVDPDTKKESPNPHYVTKQDVTVIQQWVKAGGVLVMLANDSANTELPHFNELAAVFGLHFNNDIISHVVDDAHFEDGAINIQGHPVFRTSKKIFMKDACSIGIKGAGKAVLKSKDAAIIAAASHGKGTVVAVGDPWLYNEYVNGRLPAAFENDKAAADFVKWLLLKVPAKK